MIKTSTRLLLLAGVLVIAGCAQRSPLHRDATRASLQCPAGYVMTCEARKIGRIRHGTFARSTDRCGCVQQDANTLESPVIPNIPQQ